MIFSPVIELMRCNFDGKILRTGRVYFTKGFYDKEGLFVQWPDEFLQLGDKVLKIVKRYCERDKSNGVYVGPHAKEWLDKGGKIVWN